MVVVGVVRESTLVVEVVKMVVMVYGDGGGVWCRKERENIV